MKAKLLVCVFIISVAFACSKSSNIEDPTEDLAWLKTKKTEMSKNCSCIPSIWQATYEDRTIYETGISEPTCNGVHIFYEEDGKVVQGSENVNIVEFHAKMKNKKLIWSCKIVF